MKIRKVLKELPRRNVFLLMTVAVLINYFLPSSTVFAALPSQSDIGNYGIIQVHGATTLENVTNANEVTAVYDNGTIVMTGTGLYSDGNNHVYSIGPVTVDCTPNANYTCELWNNGTNSHGTTLNLNNIVANEVINVDATFENSTNPGPGPEPDENHADAAITVSAGTGTYNMTRHNPNTGEDFVEAVPYDDMINFRINGSFWDPENGASIHYDTNPSDTTVVFTFETLWINRYYENIVINGTSYNVSDYIDFDDRTSWLTHNNGEQTISFSIPNVPKADSYNIVAKHGENNGTKYLATFLWTADPAQANTDDYIGNSTLEFVKAVYQVADQTYTVKAEDMTGSATVEGDFTVMRSDDGFLSYGVNNNVDFDDGGLTLPGEAEVTMRVVPNYGYQVTSVNGGNNFVTTDEGVSEFTVVVHNGEAGYFKAEVTPVDDVVKANSTKIASGTVVVDGDEIGAGTVELSVDDVQLSSDKIKDFEKAVGKNYEINSYLDINLNQILYRGTEDDVWTNQIHQLNNEATISLKLEEGIDVNDIVIVHNIDDGDEFEVINIDSYDPATRIITFKTKSFSNYAIASKTGSSSILPNPQTLDDILFYCLALGLSILGIVGLRTYIRKRLN